MKKRKEAYEAAEDMLMVLDEDNELSPERVEEIIADRPFGSLKYSVCNTLSTNSCVL